MTSLTDGVGEEGIEGAEADDVGCQLFDEGLAGLGADPRRLLLEDGVDGGGDFGPQLGR